MRRLAVIPARGGSKRLPRKNVLPFLGQPMFAHSVAAALASGLFERVIVSTEDEEIAGLVDATGAILDARPAELATDRATLVEVCLDVLDRERAAGRDYDVICLCYATAPMRNAADIAATVALIEPGVCDFAQAVTHFSHYPHQAMRTDAGGYLQPMWPEWACKRSSDVPPLLAGNGSTYAAWVPAFREVRDFIGPRTRGYTMPFARSIDIDTREDYELACAVASVQGKPA